MSEAAGVLRDRDRVPTPHRPDEVDLRYCVWELTLACDLGCKHCGSRAGKARASELSTHEALDVVRQLADLGCREVFLIGGEAYLRDDWDVIAAAIGAAGMRCGMTTGARALSQERIARAAAAGIDSFSLSLDGLERTHDLLRGSPGSFRAVLQAADSLQHAGIAFGFNTQINRASLPELPAIAQLLVDRGGVAWQVQLTVPMGRAADRPDLLLQPLDLLEVFPLLAWLRETRLAPAGVELQPGNDIGYYGAWDERLRRAGVQWSPCSAGRNTLGIEADGTIKGCPSLPTAAYGGGSVRDRSIADILSQAAPVTHLRRRTREDLWGFCGTCTWADQCLGGCSWTSHVYMGKTGNNPFCIHRVQTLEQRGVHEHLTRVAAPPGLPFDHGHFSLEERALPQSPAEPQLGGLPLPHVLALTPESGSAWDMDTLRGFVRRT